MESESFPYLQGENQVGVLGLLDSGAAINVLPYDVGLRLGAVWEQQTTPVKRTGNMASAEARILIVDGVVGKLPAVKLGFAWSRVNDVPIILGQINFFLEFDVCFLRSRGRFEIKPKPAE